MGEATDVLIVGAGISGLSMAAHMQDLCPHHSFRIVEARGRAGGTWDLFRYPGVRSDSDMHTLGFAFAPWRGAKAIADGGDILAYLDQVIAERGLDPYIAYGTRVLTADWHGGEALWHVRLADAAGERVVQARFLYLAAGYYDYEQPHEAHIPGIGDFAGPVAHPQFWPQDLDWAGKRVVVIGSGATAVTLVPAMADKAAQVTMLQRTPYLDGGPAFGGPPGPPAARRAAGEAGLSRDPLRQHPPARAGLQPGKGAAATGRCLAYPSAEAPAGRELFGQALPASLRAVGAAALRGA
jgi:monooxygenase